MSTVESLMDTQCAPANAFDAILYEDRHHKPEAYKESMNRTFRGVDVEGKAVIDVGSGRGLTSLWLALQGAGRVVSMEPEMVGSRSGAVQVQRERILRLGLKQVEIETSDFQRYQPDELFDVLVSNASINHLEESVHHALHDRKTFDAFVAIASKMKRWLRPGGVAVITDASRYAFFSLAKSAGLSKQYCYYRKNINYRIHQNPRTWKQILNKAGFSRIEIDYSVPHALRFAEPVVNNSVASFFLQGSFILRAWN